MNATSTSCHDDALRADVVAELRLESFLNPDRMGVEVRGGVVSLTGFVESFAEKRAADSAARYAAGPAVQIVGVSIKRFGLPGVATSTGNSLGSREHDQNNIHRTPHEPALDVLLMNSDVPQRASPPA